MERPWPLVGRDEELALLVQAVRRADGPRGMVLAGAAGVGKSRLARETIRLARSQGRTTHRVCATTSSQPLPLGAFAMLVGDLGSDPTQLLQRAADALLEGTGPTGPVLVVDDAHLLDDLSAALIQQLVVHRRVSLFLTVRSGEPSPAAVESVWKDGFLGRVEVQPLSRGETATLLARVLDGPVEDRTAQRLFDLTGGNALYLRHVVGGEVAAGRLREVGDLWRWEGRFTASDPLVELVDQRLVGLAPPVTDVLDTLAVAGELDVDVLAMVVPAGSIEQAEATGLVQVTSQTGALLVGMAHPLYGEVRARRLGRLRARRLRGLVAKALGDQPTDRAADVLRRGVLALDSDLPPDPALLTAAAQSALRLLDWDLAVRLADAAAASGGGFDASLTLSYALSFGADPVRADGVLAELVQNAATDAELLQAGVPRAGHLFFMQARPTDATRVLTEVRSKLGDPSLRSVGSMLAMFEAMAGNPLEAIRLAREALEGPPLAPLADLCAIWALVVGLGTAGRLDELPGDFTRRHADLQTSYESSMPSIGYAFMHTLALRLQGGVREAEGVGERFRSDIRDGTAVLSLFVDGMTAWSALAAGRVRTAGALAERTIDALRERRAVSHSGWAYVTSIALTTACAMAGDGPAAKAAGEAMDEDFHAGFAVMEPDRLLAWAWTRAANAAVGEAIDLAHRAAAVAAEREQAAYEVLALATAVRFGDRSVATRLRQLADEVDGSLAPAAALQARALADRDAASLIEASRAFEEMGDLLSAADAAAQATTVLREAGLVGSAHTAMARAAGLQEACQGALTPALRGALSPLPLTDREREVVTLAAEGLTNREIADRLVVSVRTVEGHLYRASAKLGTSRRTDFRGLLTGG